MNNNKYNDTYLGRIGNWLSQGGHTLAGGSSDVSISAKSGYMAEVKKVKYWVFLKAVIDWAFSPIDGQDHGGKAYRLDEYENYEIGVGKFQDVVCTFFVLIVCPIVAIFTYTIKALRYVFAK